MSTTPPETPPPPGGTPPDPTPADPTGASSSGSHGAGPDLGGPRATRDDARDLGRLRRSVGDRKVAGVAAGLARHFDVDPLVLRVAFVVLAFFGGAGLIVYAACWLLVPEEGADRAPLHFDERTRSLALIIAGAIAAVAVVGDSWGAFWFPWPVAIIALVVLWLVTRDNTSSSRPAPGPAVPPADQPTGQAYGPPHAQTYGQTYAGPAPRPGQFYAGPAHPTHGYGGAPGVQSAYAAPAYAPPAYGPPTYAPPATASPGGPHPRKRGPILFWFTLALIALAMGVVGIVDLAGAPVADPVYPAVAVAISGVMLLIGSFYGRAGGIILVGLIATVGLVGATAAQEVERDSLTVMPTTAAAVDDVYSTGIGEQRIDLSEVEDLGELDGRTIRIEGNLGSIDVTVPRGLRVEVDARVSGPGGIKLFGDQRDGWDVRDSAVVGDPDDPTITLDVELGVGTIEVTH